jgi:hypothetical protein
LITLFSGVLSIVKNFLLSIIDVLRSTLKVIEKLLKTLICEFSMKVAGISLAIDKMGKEMKRIFDNISSVFSGESKEVPNAPSTSKTIMNILSGVMASSIVSGTAEVFDSIMSSIGSIDIVGTLDSILVSLASLIKDGFALLEMNPNELTGLISELCEQKNFFNYILGKVKEVILKGATAILSNRFKDLPISDADKAKGLVVCIEYLKNCDNDIGGLNDDINKKKIAEKSVQFIGKSPLKKSMCNSKSNKSSVKNGLLQKEDNIVTKLLKDNKC